MSPPATPVRPKIRLVRAKQIIVKSNLPEASYVVNPYTGCQTGCLYCYSAFIKRWSGHGREPWGTFVDVKANAPALVDNRSFSGNHILLSSVTDPYQPLESKYSITRDVLLRLATLDPQPAVEVLTKSSLIIRDVGVLKRFKQCRVGFSFCTLDDTVRRTLEPVTPLIKRRVAAVRQLHEAGIPTYASVSPILPYITDVEQIVCALRQSADYFVFENLNVPPYVWPSLKAGLARLDPALIPRYHEIYFRPGGHSLYWGPVLVRLRELVRREGLQARFFLH